MFDRIARCLPSLIREAGRIVLQAHDIASGITVKDGTANFVTVYDTKVQAFLMQRLTELVPDAVFVAEEKENDTKALCEDYCFVIDPIDGTTNFIYDYHHSCISVGLLSRGEPVIGAVYDPYLDELFFAQKGKGATLNEKPIRVSNRTLGEALVAYGTAPYYRDELGKSTFALLQALFMRTADIRRCGSAALDLAYLAAGRNDVFFEMLLSPWDYAAGYVLITEAGGRITQLDGTPVSYAGSQPILASNAVLFRELLDIVKKTVN